MQTNIKNSTQQTNTMKIFYARSTYKCTINDTYYKICSSFENDDTIDIIDVDNSDEPILLDKIKKLINECDLFVCDVTPDYIEPDTNNMWVNHNVMLELGYAISKMNENNIIVMLDTTITKSRPSIIEGFCYTEYKYDNGDEYYLDIIDKIKKISEENNYYGNDNGWKNFDYVLSDRFLEMIVPLTGVYLKNYIIKINIKNKKMIMILTSNGLNRIVDIETKIMNAKNKEFCLSTNKELYDELQHLEMIIILREFTKS
jgi:hypothetical protein